MKKFYTVPELAKISGVGYQKIYKLIKKGLPFIKKEDPYQYIKTIAKGKEWKKKEKRQLKYTRKVILIDYDDWLEIPAFIREGWKRKSKKTTGIKEADIYFKT